MRRTFFLAVIALVLVLIVAFFAFLFSPNAPSSNAVRQSGGGFFGSLFPFNFGGNGSARGVTEPTGGTPETAVDNRPVPSLRQVSEKPVSGGYLYRGKNEEALIRYVERETGNLYETPAESRARVRISKTTVPGVLEVLFANSSTYIMRYLNESGNFENFYTTVVEGEEQSLDGDFLNGWERGVIDSAGKTLLVVKEGLGGSSVIASNVNGSNARTLLSSPIRSWVPLISNTGFYVYSAPAADVSGFLYQISGGTLKKIGGEVAGMMVRMSASGQYALISGGNGRDISLSLLDIETNAVYRSPLGTIATKCVFISEKPVRVVCGVPENIPPGEYPNDWLLGRTAFSDDVWLIEAKEGVATLLSIPKDDVGQAIDVWQPFADPRGDYVGFINKNDLSLWSLRLSTLPVDTSVNAPAN